MYMTAANVERLESFHGGESISDDIVKPDGRSVLARSFRIVGYIQVFQTFETVAVECYCSLNITENIGNIFCRN